MRISKEQTIAEVQRDFQARFPGLKLGFYQREHQENEGSPKKTEYAASLSLGALNARMQEGDIELISATTVAELEHELEQRFGLHVQVFRRSNTLWLQTTSTDNWSLETQNRKGLHSIQNS